LLQAAHSTPHGKSCASAKNVRKRTCLMYMGETCFAQSASMSASSRQQGMEQRWQKQQRDRAKVTGFWWVTKMDW